MRLRLVLALAATLVCASLAAADLTITFNTVSKGPMGAGGTGTEVHYYSPDFHLVRNEKEQRDSLVDFRQGISYAIDHKKKVITKISFEDAAAALDNLSAAQPEGMGAMMGGMFGDPNDVHVDKVGPDTVAGRACTAWTVRVGKMAMAMSTDPTLKMPMPDATYAKMMRSRAAQFAKAGPMGANYKRLFEEMAKLKGVPLRTHMTAMMMDVATEATKIETGAIPASVFALPDYKVEDMGKKLRQGAKGK